MRDLRYYLLLVFAIVLLESKFSTIKAGVFTSDIENEFVDNASPIKQIRSFRLPNSINAAAWSPNGRLLALLSDYGSQITILARPSWKIKNSFNGAGGAYSFNSFFYGNNNEIFTAGAPTVSSLDAHAIIKWSATTGNILGYMPSLSTRRLDQYKNYHSNVFAISRDYQLVAAADASIRNGVYLFLVENGNLIRIFRPNTPGRRFFNATSLAFSPNGQAIAIGTGRGKLYIYNTSTGLLSRSYDLFPLDEYSCAAISFSPDGKYIAIGKSKNENLSHDTLSNVEIIDAKTGILIVELPGIIAKEASINETAPVWQIAWNLSGQKLAVADLVSLRVWSTNNVKKPGLLLSLERSQGFSSTSFSPDDILAATSGNEVFFFH